MLNISRRGLLVAAPFIAAPSVARASALAKGKFTHGVASGDPTSSAVILWTRLVPTGTEKAISWEIAEDEAFAKIAARGQAEANAFDDFCVKVDAQGLKPGRRYFYRFLAGDGASPTGLTRTAPAGDAPSLKFALFSCSSKPWGYFRAYQNAASREDIDVCFHVGDYLYEYAPGNYPSAAQAVPGRLIAPDHETVSPSDYHARYASYREDPDLQEIHRTKPFLAVWDDHELTNDAWMDGAQNHQPETEGPWSARKVVAAKAYHDWMPIRRQDSWTKIYRRFEWGTLASILMLDTRLIGREQQLDWAQAVGPAADKGTDAIAAAAMAFAKGKLADPRRTLMGPAQEQWMRAELKRSKARGATWQVLAQQLVIAEQIMPPNIATMLAPGASERNQKRAALGTGLGQMGLGWNLDAWTGYPAARARFLAACAQDGVNALTLGGDSHNTWFNNLPGGKQGRPAALEIAGGSVTSPGMESNFPNAPAGGREAALREANQGLAFCDASHRGYATATLTRAGVESEWVAFDNVRAADAPVVSITKGAAEATRVHGPSPWKFA
jgi:alkaline phosphatase D